MTTAPLSNDARAIEELRSKLGGRLTIVGHHYEQEATIQHCDIRGDSLVGLLAGHGLDELLDGGHTGGAADEDDLGQIGELCSLIHFNSLRTTCRT